MGDDEGRVDLALFDELQKLGQIVLYRRLSHPERQTAIDCRSHRNFIEETAIDAHDRDRAEVAAAMDRLPQDMWPVRAHEGRGLDAVPP